MISQIVVFYVALNQIMYFKKETFKNTWTLCITDIDLIMQKGHQTAVPYLCRQVAAHSTGMGVQGHSGEQAHPAAGGRSGRSSEGSLQPESVACWSWGSHKWGFLDDCRARRSQLELKGDKQFRLIKLCRKYNPLQIILMF